MSFRSIGCIGGITKDASFWKYTALSKYSLTVRMNANKFRSTVADLPSELLPDCTSLNATDPNTSFPP